MSDFCAKKRIKIAFFSSVFFFRLKRTQVASEKRIYYTYYISKETHHFIVRGRKKAREKKESESAKEERGAFCSAFAFAFVFLLLF